MIRDDHVDEALSQGVPELLAVAGRSRHASQPTDQQESVS